MSPFYDQRQDDVWVSADWAAGSSVIGGSSQTWEADGEIVQGCHDPGPWPARLRERSSARVTSRI
jgi:hypothetical protein